MRLVGALVSVNDFASRPARILTHDEILKTGKYRFRLRQTPHVPHNWEASMLFEKSAERCSAQICSPTRGTWNR